MDERLHILGVRHHGPGSAALLRQALDVLQPECVLIEGPPEADDLIPYAAAVGMKPTVALLLYAEADANAAIFFPLAEFSPEWQAMQWALGNKRAVRFIDWPAGASIHRMIEQKKRLEEHEQSNEETDPDQPCPDPHVPVDPLDRLAAAAGYSDGETFWNALIEQGRARAGDEHRSGAHALEVFAEIESAMTVVRAEEESTRVEGTRLDETLRESQREAWMRTQIRRALKEHAGPIAVVVGAWHVSALRTPVTAASDKAILKDLARAKVEATWVPWTDSRLSAITGYGAGVISPGWYRHLWALYAEDKATNAEEFTGRWQAKTAAMLRREGYAASTAGAIEASRLAIGLAAMRGKQIPGLEEIREAALATLCHGEPVPLRLIEQKLYLGERVGEIDPSVPQMPLARDLALWQKKTRLKPEDIDTEVRVDLRSEAGLLKSTLLHRLLILKVPWGRVVEADAGRGTFREVWQLRWVPELSVALAEALVYGGTIESAAANSQLERAGKSSSIPELAEMIRATLVADLPEAATACIERLQAAAVEASEITELMHAVVPLVRVLRYGAARKLPEAALRALILALSVEVNAGVRMGSHGLDEETASARVQAMRAYDEALLLFSDATLLESWRAQLARMVDDNEVVAPVAGLSLRRLHDLKVWELQDVIAAFSRHTSGESPQRAGAFLESFLSGASEMLLQDQPLLRLLDAWMCELREDDFTDALPLLRRSFSSFDSVARRRLIELISQGPESNTRDVAAANSAMSDIFAEALPLLYQILGIATIEGGQS